MCCSHAGFEQCPHIRIAQQPVRGDLTSGRGRCYNYTWDKASQLDNMEVKTQSSARWCKHTLQGHWSLLCLLISLFHQAWPSSHPRPPPAYHAAPSTKLQINTPWHIFSLSKTWNENNIRYQSRSQLCHWTGTINDDIIIFSNSPSNDQPHQKTLPVRSIVQAGLCWEEPDEQGVEDVCNAVKVKAQ